MKKRLRYLSGFSMVMITVFCLTYTALSTEINQTTDLPVLLYHHLLSNGVNKNFNDSGAVNSFEDFEAQMEYLYENGYRTITSEQLYNFLYNNMTLPPKSVMITFDDGYLSNYYYAYPTLKKYNYTAVIFLITGLVGNSKEGFDPDRIQFLTMPDIRDTTDVFEYACHTHDLHYYQNGNSKLLTTSKDAVAADIGKSLSVNKTNMFAYPYGLYNNDVISVLKEHNFSMAFSNVKGYIRQGSNKFTLKRFSIKQKTSFDEFKSYMDKTG